ncbi:hypothetical protein TVAGG3_0551520 [Trichomonas vaginalis G3]|uniref:hypothetical protein n=1 Tax=Trichomonas vaginalis (strain ATCC PRA-98 / G3) TaxID=412133 RepID=UPI0021E54FDB|nr:hypothetical protein TVAGG3_0551520 [Trichomonas vaginalis G3]KAI5520538.1 hypothetical protein TVAGG3_0551520 [Trichomonas vaginalis G3]
MSRLLGCISEGHLVPPCDEIEEMILELFESAACTLCIVIIHLFSASFKWILTFSFDVVLLVSISSFSGSFYSSCLYRHLFIVRPYHFVHHVSLHPFLIRFLTIHRK